MFALWLMIAFRSFSSAEVEVEDGKSYSNNITSILGGSSLYKFHIADKQDGQDLAISLTTFSDWSDPDMYIKTNSEPTTTDFD